MITAKWRIGVAQGLFIALLLTLFTVATYADTPKRGGILYIGQDFGPQSLDAHKTAAWASVNIFELVYDTLLRWDSEMKLEPSLAKSWTVSDDGLTYTFYLRDNVYFHNGRPMVAEDVKFSLERVIDPETNSPNREALSAIKSIETPDDYTVVIHLAKPFAPLLSYLATPNYSAIVPKEEVDRLASHPVGTGPFMFEAHVPNQYVRLKAHPQYWEPGLPYLDGVEFKLLGDEASIIAALRSRTVDMAWLKDPKVAANLARRTRGLISQAGQPSRFIDIKFNVKKPPFDDVRVRRAMSLALDRNFVVNTVLGGYGQVGTMIVQEGYKHPNPEQLPYYQRDVQKAKELLAEAGYPNGLTIDNYKVVAANALDVQAAEVMKQQWAEAGIHVTINPMEVGAILQDWQNGNYDMISVGVVWAPDPDYYPSIQMLSTASFAQNQGINDPEIDRLLNLARETHDVEKRQQIYREFQEYAADQVYNIVIYTYPLRWEMMWDYVKGYKVMASNARLYLRETWLDR